MGFNNCYIPDIDVLTNQHNEYGLKWLYQHYRNYDSWSGDSDAMNYLESKVKEYEKVINDINNNTNIDKL